jgi:4-diphosphocytidyl-2-C-methyl-D-erythritol kinase
MKKPLTYSRLTTGPIDDRIKNEAMVSFPNCKINIGLKVVGKRPDGFHNLETVFYPLHIKDGLEVVPSDTFSFSCSGLPIDGDAASNLCIKAWRLLQKDFRELPPMKIHLHKAIPMGAGLGGGSADAAYMLLAFNSRFDLRLNKEQLIGYASQLGSDCAFFIINTPCFAEGRGELLQPIPLDMAAYKILLVNPGIHINTAWAFQQVGSSARHSGLQEHILLPVDTWKENIVNDFEGPVFKAHPGIAAIKHGLYAQGALYASMSGSGSSVFGIFQQAARPALNFPAHYFYRWI